jgi:hypothetical protein
MSPSRRKTPPAKSAVIWAASRLGVACERALQFEYADAPVDVGAEFPGRTLRIFEVGHALEDLAIRWLRLAGFDLYTRRKDGEQFGFSVADGRIQGHLDGVIANAPPDLGLTFPMLWECKTMNDKNWRDTVKKGVAVAKPVYAGQIATYQAYMEPSIPAFPTTRRCSPRSTRTPRRFGLNSSRSMAAWRSECPTALFG